jgi:hypothetical protein
VFFGRSAVASPEKRCIEELERRGVPDAADESFGAADDEFGGECERDPRRAFSLAHLLVARRLTALQLTLPSSNRLRLLNCRV